MLIINVFFVREGAVIQTHNVQPLTTWHIFKELLKQKILLHKSLLSNSEQDTSHKLCSDMVLTLAGDLILVSIMSFCSAYFYAWVAPWKCAQICSVTKMLNKWWVNCCRAMSQHCAHPLVLLYINLCKSTCTILGLN